MTQSKEIKLRYVDMGDGEQHIADYAVIKRINDLEQALDDEQTAHAKTKASINSDNRLVAERIALNLNSGMQESDRCLAHSLDYFSRTKDGEPVLEFKDEVMRRITLALEGKNYIGNDYR